MTRPELSIVVVVYDMARAAPRALQALSAHYQRGVRADQYEVLVIDNGSPEPLGADAVTRWGGNFEYHYLPKSGASPAPALAFGVQRARAPYVGLLIDGARIATPGLVRHALSLRQAFECPVGLTLGWHLGPDLQTISIEQGYDAAAEERLLQQIAWPSDGYRLFEIAALHHPDESWLQLTGESPCTFLARELLDRIGGFDARFVSPGGGFIGHDFVIRLAAQHDADLVMILGEGTFHQLHGGATSGVGLQAHRALSAAFHAEYREIRGQELVWPIPERPLQFIGHLPPAARQWLRPFAAGAQPLVMERDRQLRELHREVAQRDRTIAWLHGEVRVRDEAVSGLHTEVATRDATVAALQRSLARALDPGMSLRNPYDFQIDEADGGSHARALGMIAGGQRVLDLGCATGYLARSLAARDCTVVGVERNATAADRARSVCDRVIVADLNAPGWEESLGEDRFDVVLAADVLEHLHDPLACLRAVVPYLREGGSLVLSLPNVAHGSVRLALLSGAFHYTELGLLDRTHLRFFTRSSAEALCAEAGLAVIEIQRVQREILDTEIPLVLAQLPPGLAEWLDGDTDARTYQFVLRAVPVVGRDHAALASRLVQAQREADELRARMRTLCRGHGGAGAADDAAQLRATLADLGADLAARDARLAAKEALLAQRAEDLQVLNGMLEAKDEHYRALQAFVARKDAESSAYVASLCEQLAVREAALAEMQARLRGLESRRWRRGTAASAQRRS